jgi:DNA sulfur modification protein DndE
MADLTLQRIPFTPSADNQMRTLKGRTGITPNFFCRLGFCLSLDEPGIPEAPDQSEETGREINRFTLLGEYDVAYVALLKVWMEKKKLSARKSEKIDELFIAHMNRGVGLIVSRIKTLSDVGSLAR